MSHGFDGSNVSRNAAGTVIVLVYPTNILLHAKTCTASQIAPLAQTQASSSES
jgi:hypothetical protein